MFVLICLRVICKTVKLIFNIFVTYQFRDLLDLFLHCILTATLSILVYSSFLLYSLKGLAVHDLHSKIPHLHYEIKVVLVSCRGVHYFC